jgi:murein DD-endopeptidase MepM/ murein hydrolase activator NlpD
VHAAAAGTVIYAGWMEGYGNLVVIDHGDGLSTAYGHNSSLASSLGQSVSAGQVIAYSGSTGHSTGPHVHFEVRVNGAPVDPLGYL